MGDRYSPYSWARDLVPQAVWIALVIDRFGFKEGCALCARLASVSDKVCSTLPTPIFNRTSSFLSLSGIEAERVRQGIGPAAASKLSDALGPLSAAVQEHPLSFLVSRPLNISEQEHLISLLPDLYDRMSRLAVMSMGAAYFVGLEQGKVHVAPHLVKDLTESFSAIEYYPDTEDSKRAAGRFRASAPMMLRSPEDDTPGDWRAEPWISTFWEAMAGIGDCLVPDTFLPEIAEGDGFEHFIAKFRNAVRSDVRHRFQAYALNLERPDEYEVVTALLARQATLAMEFSAAPAMWTPHLAPIILRAMADVLYR